MFKALVVDDEKMIRTGLMGLITWEEYGIEIIGEASNGLDALQLLENDNIHIVITDIKMPKYTGLELIKACHQKKIPTKFIVLSGYDDFEFVKEALKYNVENYLLKPINKDELKETLDSIISKLEANVTEEMTMQNKDYFRNNLLNRIINNKISNKEFKDKLRFIGMASILESALQVALIRPDSEKGKYSNFTEDKLLSMCNTHLDSKSDYIFLGEFGKIIIIFMTDTDIEKNGSIEKLKKIIEVMSEKDVRVTVAIGKRVDSYRQASISFKTALEVNDYMTINNENEIMNYSSLRNHRELTTYKMIIDFDIIDKYIRGNRCRELCLYVNKVIAENISNNQCIESDVQSLMIEILIKLFSVIRENEGDISEVIESPNILFGKILEMQSIDSITTSTIRIFEILFDYLDGLCAEDYSPIVQNTIDYINKHYQDEMSLKILSSILYANPMYIGRVFKKEVGQVFTDYINDIRLNEAKKLLIKTTMNTTAIAENVGFKNKNYFYTIFKKKVNMTPTEYRQLY